MMNIQNLDVDLLRIRTEADYDRALARANELMDIVAAKGTDSPEAAELDILTDLIEHYESRHWPV
jgi:HTH-type transcriptional regulator / antitoxin HigA